MGLIDLILCEILQGIHDQEEFVRVKGDLLKFQVFHSGGPGWRLLLLRTIGSCAGAAIPSARRSIV
jgi:hypothetical protein